MGKRKIILLSLNTILTKADRCDLILTSFPSSSIFLLSRNIMMNIPLQKMAPENMLIRIMTLSWSATCSIVPLLNLAILLGQSFAPQKLFTLIVPFCAESCLPVVAMTYLDYKKIWIMLHHSHNFNNIDPTLIPDILLAANWSMVEMRKWVLKSKKKFSKMMIMIRLELLFESFKNQSQGIFI